MIRKYLDTDATKTLVHAYVTSRLDYCNLLLYGTPNELTDKLQRVQNTAARLLTRTRKYDHITPVLKISTGSQLRKGSNTKYYF